MKLKEVLIWLCVLVGVVGVGVVAVHAVVTTTTPRNDYTGTGATATYSYTFRIFDVTDLLVIQTDVAGNVSTLTYPTSYTVTGVNKAAGGTITLTAGVLGSGEQLAIKFNRTPRQSTDLRNQGSFLPETHESKFDELTRYIQALEEKVSRSLKQPDQETGTASSATLPAAADRASMFMAWDGSGNPIAAAGTSASLTPVSVFINTLLDAASASAARTTLDASKTEPLDSAFRIQGSADSTKKVALEVDGLTTGTTRTVTVPDKDVTLGTTPMTPVATTSATSHDITGIPEGVRVIIVTLVGVSTSGTANLVIQIGDSGGIENSSYASSVSEIGAAASATTSSFLVTNAITAATLVTGSITLTLHDSSTNTWIAAGTFIEETGSVIVMAGRKATSATLDRIRLTTTGSDTFDAGAINVAYQY
jgi:hypothetical protein